jgi:hypothetical protein
MGRGRSPTLSSNRRARRSTRPAVPAGVWDWFFGKGRNCAKATSAASTYSLHYSGSSMTRGPNRNWPVNFLNGSEWISAN